MQFIVFCIATGTFAGTALLGVLSVPIALFSVACICVILLLRYFERRNRAELVGLLTIYGLCTLIIVGQLVWQESLATRIALLFVPVIAIAGLLDSARGAWSVTFIAAITVTANLSVRGGINTGDSGILSDSIMLCLAYLAMGFVVHSWTRVIASSHASDSQNRRKLAERNALLERQIRERELVETRHSETTLHMRELIGIANELAESESLESLWKRAIELALSRLGIERCGIFVLDEAQSEVSGTFGVDGCGRIRNESSLRMPVAGQRWEKLLDPKIQPERPWMHDDATTNAKDDPGVYGRPWATVTVLRSQDGQPIGLFFADTAITQRPFDPVKQDLIALFCSIVGAAAGQKRLEVDVRRRDSQAAAMRERSRLARELHDSVSQALFGIVLGSRTAIEYASTESARKPLDYVLTLAESALLDIRALIYELRPESLAQDGFLPAVGKQVSALTGRHGIQFEITENSIEPDAGIDIKEALYRVCLEAVQNAIKHAAASSIVLDVRQDDTGITLLLSDNGRGFDPDREYDGHFGLVNMRERMSRIAGTCQITSAPGAGTRVRLTVPASVLSARESA
jgi:signal transduction histidine kinase